MASHQQQQPTEENLFERSDVRSILLNYPVEVVTTLSTSSSAASSVQGPALFAIPSASTSVLIDPTIGFDTLGGRVASLDPTTCNILIDGGASSGSASSSAATYKHDPNTGTAFLGAATAAVSTSGTSGPVTAASTGTAAALQTVPFKSAMVRGRQVLFVGIPKGALSASGGASATTAAAGQWQ
jgi:hypothetical protein